MEVAKLSEDDLKLGFTFDHNKCIVCGACVDACNKAYGGNWRALPTFETEGAKTALSISCNHCDNPVCLSSCPANAITKDKNGIVKINSEKCIGCGYCQWACPYEALHFSKDGTMSKCHLCFDRLGKGLPYCVEACPTGALTFGWLKEPDGNVSYLAPASITKPRLKVIPPHVQIKATPIKRKAEKNSIGLISFTLGSELALTYTLFKLPFFQIISLVLLASTLILSLGHARVSAKALRVVLNLSTSWLSREVLFGGLSILALLFNIIIRDAYFIVLPLLALTVISSIMIYVLPSRPSWYHIDTPVSFIGTSFTVVPPLAYLFIHSYLLLALGGAFALIEMLTARMKLRMGFKDKRLLNLLYLALLVVGAFFIPLTLLASVIALISEVIHRREFYQKVIYYGVPTV